MGSSPQEQLRAYVTYLRDLGIYDLYRRDDPQTLLPQTLRDELLRSSSAAASGSAAASSAPTPRPSAPAASTSRPPATLPGTPLGGNSYSGSVKPQSAPAQQQRPFAPVPPPVPQPEPPAMSYFDTAPPIANLSPALAAPMPKPKSFDQLAPLPTESIPPDQRMAALEAIRADIGDCTRCPLAYAGRHKIVFADGDANAKLMFVGEGPGADEDASGLPFVGKAGQLLNNMIDAMGVTRESVYIANIVKCRPPGNRTPEFEEATTCSQFLLRQIDVVRPQVIVALGATAATYLLGVRQSLSSLRGRWHSARGAKVAVTYHPAFLLRDPRQKGEAWKDLQMVMAEMGLKPPKKAGGSE